MRIITAAASGKAYGRKHGIPHMYLFPYDLVERGDEGKAIKKGEATREEYVLGLKRMEAQRRFIAHALRVLSRHQEKVAQDNCSIPWETVRRYSEEILMKIADGRLPQGWDDQAALYILRIEVITAAGKVHAPAHSHGHGNAPKAADPDTQPRRKMPTTGHRWVLRVGHGTTSRPHATRPERASHTEPPQTNSLTYADTAPTCAG